MTSGTGERVPVSVLRRAGALFEPREVSTVRFILCVAAFLIAFSNRAFFRNVLDAFPATPGNAPFLVSVVVVFAGVTLLALGLLSWRRTTKPLAVVLVLVAAISGYFMDTYDTIIDDGMLRNVLRTDAAEVADLLSVRLALYLVLLGLLPAALIWRTKIVAGPLRTELRARAKLLGLTLGGVLVAALPLTDYYSSFLREHKELRYYSNPGCVVYAATKVVKAAVRSGTAELRQVGLDARIPAHGGPRKLLILVVGEAARADRFSLNGYGRETNPRLAELPVVSFPDFWSYGTSTAISVPYMFSVLPRSEFDLDAAESTENVLDVAQRAGVHVLWLDNNSSSKGVAERVPYQDYKKPSLNPVCDVECRDEGMLRRLQPWIDERPEGDLLVVLHAMGNHGPAYWKRYPAAFERFTPVRRTNQLQECTDEEIGNAYDNAILYTDHFLAETVEFLRANDPGFDVAMLYVSDHGESLGENGVYLHGLPNFVAPDVQRHVAALFWMGEGFGGVDREALVRRSRRRASHDHVPHSLLGLLGIETSVYDPELDLFRGAE